MIEKLWDLAQAGSRGYDSLHVRRQVTFIVRNSFLQQIDRYFLFFALEFEHVKQAIFSVVNTCELLAVECDSEEDFASLMSRVEPYVFFFLSLLLPPDVLDFSYAFHLKFLLGGLGSVEGIIGIVVVRINRLLRFV